MDYSLFTDFPALVVFAVIALGPIITVWATVFYTLKGIRRGGFIQRMPLMSGLLMYVLFSICTIIVASIIVGVVNPIGIFLLYFSYAFLYVGGFLCSLIFIYVRGRKIP